MNTPAILFTSPQQVALSEVAIPEPGPGEVLVETIYSCISPGTELRCLIVKDGPSDYPYIPGYSLSGRVAAVGEGVNLALGTPVYCGGTTKASVTLGWGGQTSYALQPAARVYPLPEGVDLLEASLIHLAAIAFHGVRIGNPRPDEKLALVGLGPIGMLSAMLYTLTGAHIIAADLSPERVALAKQLGVDAFVPQGTLAEAFRPFFPNGADVVVDATGFPAVLPQALALTRVKPWDESVAPGARFIIQGSYAGEFSIPYRPAFLNEVSFWLPRDMQPRDVHAVIDLMARDKFHPRRIISDVRPPQAAPETYAELLKAKAELMTVAFQWK